MKKLIAGNWKMNGTQAVARDLATAIARGVAAEPDLLNKYDFVVCPPFVHIPTVRIGLGDAAASVALGGQDCSSYDDGAYTGDISAAMLKDLGCGYVVLGHSERRQYQGEKDTLIAAKAAKAHEKGLITIICVGEKENERSAGYETEIVGGQLEKSLPSSANAGNTVIAYEPVWAIGTGKTATPEDVRHMHAFIREKLEELLEDSGKMRILYGGSVKPENAAALMAVPHVDGALIGGASLKAEDFLAIARADRRKQMRAI